MKSNVGTVDRAIRIVFGLVLLGSSSFWKVTRGGGAWWDWCQ